MSVTQYNTFPFQKALRKKASGKAEGAQNSLSVVCPLVWGEMRPQLLLSPLNPQPWRVRVESGLRKNTSANALIPCLWQVGPREGECKAQGHTAMLSL